MKKLFKQSTQSIQNILSQQKGSTQQKLQLLQNKIEKSEEQKVYIFRDFDQKQDSILLAKAGSGKTQCLLDRMRYLAQKQYVNKDQMLVFSFCKMTIEDTKNRCKLYNDSQLFSDDKFITTIDAFCKALIDKTLIKKNKDKEQYDKGVLSIKVHEMIYKNEEMNNLLVSYLRRGKYRKIKAIFIDEAQDLNQIQYEIIIFLKQVIQCQLNFIGDPNQNIYQFNGSFEKFMLNHQGIRFYLTKNFRSHPQIEQFSKYFEHYNDDIIKIDNQEDSRIQLYIQSEYQNNDTILTIIKQLQQQGQQLKNIAFLSPVEGNEYITGLKRITNLLTDKNIPCNVLYRETKESERRNTNTTSQKGVNLMTIHGSKGLEFNVVFLLYCSDNMMNSANYEQSNFVAFNMNLLYVAMTRAKQRLIIIHDDQSMLVQKHVCSLIHRIPGSLYQSFGQLDKHIQTIEQKIQSRQKIIDEDCDFVKGSQINENKNIMLVSKYYQPELLEMNLKQGMFQNSIYRSKTGVTKFIQGVDKQSLLFLHEHLLYKKTCVSLYDIADRDTKLFKELRYENEALVGILLEQLFFYQIQYHKQQESRKSADIVDYTDEMPKISKLLFVIKDTIKYGSLKIKQVFVISTIHQFYQLIGILQEIRADPDITQYQLDERLKQLQITNITDEQYEQQEQQIRQNLIEYLNFGTISLQQLQNLDQNIVNIFNAIDKYNEGLHWNECILSIIYICSLKYSIKSKHTKYIRYDKCLFDKMKQFNNLFCKLDDFASTLKSQVVIYQKEIDNSDIIGFIDFIVIDPTTEETTIVEFKTTNDLAIEHILQIMMYDYLLQQQEQTDSNNRLVIVNALKGVQYEIKIDQKEMIQDFLTNLVQQDKFQRTNVV